MSEEELPRVRLNAGNTRRYGKGNFINSLNSAFVINWSLRNRNCHTILQQNLGRKECHRNS